ncbi:hypothetical protein ANTRET_LOCUS9986 [Anthophora retusa]
MFRNIWWAEGSVVLSWTRRGGSSRRRWFVAVKRANFQDDGRWRFSCGTATIVNHREKLRCIGWESFRTITKIREENSNLDFVEDHSYDRSRFRKIPLEWSLKNLN